MPLSRGSGSLKWRSLVSATIGPCRVPGFDSFEFLPDNATASERLSYVLTRERLDPATPNRTAPEPSISRRFDVAQERTFELVGEVRLAGEASDAILLDALDDDVVVIADRQLRGIPAARGASAFDGDLSTAWQTPFDGSLGASVRVDDGPGSIATVTVSWLDDERHSVPTQLTLSDPAGSVRIVDLPAQQPVDGVASTTVAIDPIDATMLTVAVTGIDARTTPEDFSGLPRVLPTGLAEIQLGDVAVVGRSADEMLDDVCRDDLVTLDGAPVAVRLIGTRGEALARSELRLESCSPIQLASGEHQLDAAMGTRTGFDVDRVVLDSTASSPAPAGPATPNATIDERSSTSFDLTVAASDTSTWLILEQSWNAGWSAAADGIDLGEPVLVNGYANGWLLPAAATSRQVELDWAPQRTVTIALWLSLAAGLVVLWLAAGPRRRTDAEIDHESNQESDRETDRAFAGRRLPWLPLGIGLALCVLVFAGPLVALATAGLTALGRRWRWIPAAVVVTSLTLVGVGISAFEWRYDFPAAPDWPSRFSWAAPIVWIAVTMVVVQAFRPALAKPTAPPAKPVGENVEQ